MCATRLQSKWAVMKPICLLVLAVVSSNACGRSEINTRSTNAVTVSLTTTERAWLAAHPEVRWGADPDWPPFSNLNATGQLVGVDADITRKVAQRVGMNLKIVPAPTWAEIFKKAE